MNQLFSVFSVFDWVSPLVGAVQDASWSLSGNEPANTIWLSKYALGEAKAVLTSAGINVISWTHAAFDDEGGIDVPRSQAEAAHVVLCNAGIETW